MPWTSSLCSLFSRKASSTHRGCRKPSRRARLELEALEQREVMTAGLVSPVGSLYVATPGSNTTPLTWNSGGLAIEFRLTSAGVLQESFTANNWLTIDNNVRSMTVGYVNGNDYLFELKSNGVLNAFGVQGNLPWAQWQQWDSNVQSMDLWAGRLVDLSSSGALKLSLGNGWETIDSNVESFASSGPVGASLYDLTSTGQLKSLSSIYWNWTTMDTNVQSIAMGYLQGTDYIFEMTGNGTLRQTAVGYGTAYSGWTTLDTGVRSFGYGVVNGTQEVFDLTSNGTLKANRGSGWTTLDRDVSSFAVGNLNGTTYIIDTSSYNQYGAYSLNAGNLKEYNGYGWSELTSGMGNFSLINLNGANYIVGQIGNWVVDYSGSTWGYLDGNARSVAVGNLQGTNYIFELTTTGVLQANSTGTPSGWAQLDTNVSKFAVGNLLGTNYVFDLTNAGALRANSTTTGNNWGTWDTSVSSFALAELGGGTSVVYLRGPAIVGEQSLMMFSTTGNTGYIVRYTLDAHASSFAVTNLDGTNYVFDLNTGEVVTTWVTIVVNGTAEAVAQPSPFPDTGWEMVGAIDAIQVNGTNYLNYAVLVKPNTPLYYTQTFDPNHYTYVMEWDGITQSLVAVGPNVSVEQFNG